jgi:DnaK suppressor protein
MKARKSTKKATESLGTSHTARHTELRRILEERRRDLALQLQDKMRNVRADGPVNMSQGVVDAEEASVADIQEDIEIALLQMKSETLNKVNEALSRLDEGTYGNCFECGEEISEQRLRALPFAVRCKDCEEEREAAAEREKFLTSRRGTTAMLMSMTS